MSYIDELLVEINQQAYNRNQEMIESLFDKISSSMVDISSLHNYVQLKKELNFMKRMNFSIFRNGELSDNDDLMQYYYDNTCKIKQKQQYLSIIKNNSKGIRRLKREILESINN